MSIYYKSGYKYQLSKNYEVHIDIKPVLGIKTPYLMLDQSGLLIIKKGYCWDGPSGPTVDTSNFMRGSLVHDALYQLMRESLIPESYRTQSDKILRSICREDGMSAIRAWWVYNGVNKFGSSAASPSNVKKVIKAPDLTPYEYDFEDD